MRNTKIAKTNYATKLPDKMNTVACDLNALLATTNTNSIARISTQQIATTNE